MLRLRETLVPLFLMTDRTHLLNFAGDKNEGPIYMTTGNLSSKICQMPSTHTIVMVTLLPIPIKSRNMSQKRGDEQPQTNREVCNEVLRRVLRPLTFQQNPNAESGFYNILCADGNFRSCKPALAACLADCPKYSDLHHGEWHVHDLCACPKNELGEYVPSDEHHPRRDRNLYRTLSDANTKGANAELLSRHGHRGFNMFRHIPCIVSDLLKPDLLHPMQISMLEHVLKWIIHFMKTYKQLNKYDTIWLSVPADHVLTPNNKSYKEDSKWNGKEMKESSRYRLGVVTQSLQGRSPAQCPIFNCAIECTRGLLEFYIFAWYKAHKDATLSYL